MAFSNKSLISNQNLFYVSKEYNCKYGMPLTSELFEGFSNNRSFLILIPILLTLSSFFFCTKTVRIIKTTQPKAFVTKSLIMVGVYPVSFDY